jgi:hypothetical protein
LLRRRLSGAKMNEVDKLSNLISGN